jgi:PAT family beta-lactamase induction signal transducer AmpG
VFLLCTLWHWWILPHPIEDAPVAAVYDRRGNPIDANPSLLSEFLAAFGSFFKKPGVGLTLAFILLYRFDEAQVSKVIPLFLLNPRGKGGLGLSAGDSGLVYGLWAVPALTLGGLAGGFLAARFGLKKMIPIMACSMYLPKLAYIYLSLARPGSFGVICGAVALEQFGYGFGFTAFMLYLLYFSDGPRRTAHYAICTGFMQLGLMIPGMWSGKLAAFLGYPFFFTCALCSAIPGLLIALSLKVDPQYGRRSPPAGGSTGDPPVPVGDPPTGPRARWRK